MLTSPKSLDEEQEELIDSLKEYSRLGNGAGEAISELLVVLEPHFQKEQRIVMPLLGSLPGLVSGEKIANLQEIAAAQAPLLKEYEEMFQEHKVVKELISKAENAAKKERREDIIALLEGLVHHARVEEEVLYPSALLAGTLAKCLRPEDRSEGIA